MVALTEQLLKNRFCVDLEWICSWPSFIVS